LNVKLDVSVNAESVQTLYVADKFDVNYDYAIEVPIALNDKLAVSYTGEYSGFGDIFKQVAEYDVHVGDVVIIAEIANTTPLSLGADVRLLDADGEEVDLNVVFEDNCIIEGSVDGKTEKITTLRLNVENEGGSGIDVNRLAQVDGVAFSVRVDSRNAEGDVGGNDTGPNNVGSNNADAMQPDANDTSALTAPSNDGPTGGQGGNMGEREPESGDRTQEPLAQGSPMQGRSGEGNMAPGQR
jgi:hypothetical protein